MAIRVIIELLAKPGSRAELKSLIEASYQMVLAKLPKKLKVQLGQE